MRTSASRRARPGQGKDNRRQLLIIGAAVAVVVVGLGILLYLNTRPPSPIEGVVQHPRPARGHDATVEIGFGDLPPFGGVHNPTWLNCGIYTEPMPAENAVHSMEHGAVWITYQPDLPDEEVETLQEIVRGDSFLILSPYPQQRSPIVLTSWSVQLELEEASDGRIQQFIDRYRLGPLTPERGGACTQGIGDPIP